MRNCLSALLLAALALAVGAAPASASLLAVEPDGGILLGADVFPGFAGVARLTPSGSLDPSFGEGGVAIDRQLPSAGAIGLQPDGGVVVAAHRLRPGPFVGRLRPDGSVDPAFNGTGTVENPFEAHGIRPTAILTGLPGERIGVAFYADKGKYDVWPPLAAVEGLSADGVAEGSLGALPTQSGYLEDAAILADGSLVGVSGGGEAPMLRRLVAAPPWYDLAFGGGKGRALFPGEAVHAIAADGTGFVAAGWSAATAGRNLAVARYDGGGILDTSFGQEGVSVVPLGSAIHNGRVGVGVSPDGKVVVVGSAIPPPASGFEQVCGECAYPVVARLMPDGTLDPSFGEGGVVSLNGIAAPPFATEDLAVLPDGKVLIAGGARLARLNADGTLDPSFGEGGVFSLHVCEGTDAERARAGCVPRARVRLEVSGLTGPKPSLSLRVRPNRDWALIGSVEVTLPRGLRLHPRFAAKRERVVGRVPGEPGHVPKTIRPGAVKFANIHAGQLIAKIGDGAFNALHRLRRHRRLAFRVVVKFEVPEHYEATTQTVVVRHRVGGR